MWFAMDSCGDMHEFETPAEAKQAALAFLDDERDDAGDGWSEEIWQIRWGQIHGQCNQTSSKEIEPGSVSGVSPEIQVLAEYDVIDVPDNPINQQRIENQRIGAALMTAKAMLPPGYDLQVGVEDGEIVVVCYAPDGNGERMDFDCNEESIATLIQDYVAEARSQTEAV